MRNEGERERKIGMQYFSSVRIRRNRRYRFIGLRSLVICFEGSFLRFFLTGRKTVGTLNVTYSANIPCVYLPVEIENIGNTGDYISFATQLSSVYWDGRYPRYDVGAFRFPLRKKKMSVVKILEKSS